MKNGLFDRIKVWTDLETLHNEDLNAEFNNFINNLYSAKLGSGIETVAELQATFDPGEVGSENIPSSILEHIQALAHIIREITGEDQWYESPSTSLKEIEDALDSSGLIEKNRIVSGRTDANRQPMYLVPEGTAPTINLLATAVPLVTIINGEQVIFDADDAIVGLPTAVGGAADEALVNDVALVGQESSRTLGERYTTIPIDTIGPNILANDGTLQAFKKGSEIFIAEVDVAGAALKNAFRGWMFDSADFNPGRETLSDNDVITQLRSTWVFGIKIDDDTRDLAFTQRQPFVSETQPPGALSGDYWFDLTAQVWKRLDGVSFVVANAVLLGVCVLDNANCIGARSADFDRPFSNLNTLELQFIGVENVRSKEQNVKISLYGTQYFYNHGEIDWVMSQHLDGVEASSTKYYLYLTDRGGARISAVPPHERLDGLLGFYHPSKPWRCVGSIDNDGSSNFVGESLEGLDEKYGAGFTSTAALALDIATQAEHLIIGRSRVGRVARGALNIVSNRNAWRSDQNGVDSFGGSAINMYSRAGGVTADGFISYIAYGDGSDASANSHFFFSRSGPGALKQLLKIKDGLSEFTDSIRVGVNALIAGELQFFDALGPILNRIDDGVARLRQVLVIGEGPGSRIEQGPSAMTVLTRPHGANNARALILHASTTAMKIIRGTVDVNAASVFLIEGEGFTVATNPDVNSIKILFNVAFASNPTTVATMDKVIHGTQNRIASVQGVLTTEVNIVIREDDGTPRDGRIYFMCMGPVTTSEFA